MAVALLSVSESAAMPQLVSAGVGMAPDVISTLDQLERHGIVRRFRARWRGSRYQWTLNKHSRLGSAVRDIGTVLAALNSAPPLASPPFPERPDWASPETTAIDPTFLLGRPARTRTIVLTHLLEPIDGEILAATAGMSQGLASVLAPLLRDQILYSEELATMVLYRIRDDQPWSDAFRRLLDVIADEIPDLRDEARAIDRKRRTGGTKRVWYRRYLETGDASSQRVRR